MYGVNQPKEVVADDEHTYLPPELVEQYDFDADIDDEELVEFDLEEEAIVSNYDSYIDMDQLNRDLVNGSISTYLPAQVIRVLNRRARTLLSGQVVLEYDLEVQGVAGAKSYEIRVQAR
jgi:hypothetical protein